MNVIQALRDLLGHESVLTGDEVRQRIPHIWKPSEYIRAKAICLPRSTADVSGIAKICSRFRQTLIVHGGLTNLVRSTHSNPDDVVVSMEKMDRILEVDRINRTLTVEAGALLQSIQDAALSNDLFFPLNFGAKGSCQIGGCLSTNAGGLRVLKYGMTRQLVLGLEAVLADGTVISPMHKIIKNNSGYDIKHLFIGAEGTLGIITKVVLRLYEKPLTRFSAYSVHHSFDSVIAYLKYVDRHLGGNLSAFEVFWPEAYKALSREDTPYKRPITMDGSHYVLCEAMGGDPSNDYPLFEAAISQAWANGHCDEAVLASNEAENTWFWNIREDVGSLLTLFPFRQDFDVSLPIGEMDTYIHHVKKELKNKLSIDQCYVFGHMADGNLHLIVGKDNDSDQLTDSINQIVYKPLNHIGGSVSAEHGIGLDKKAFINISRSTDEVVVMRRIKQVMDPNGILNPGKIFDGD